MGNKISFALLLAFLCSTLLVSPSAFAGDIDPCDMVFNGPEGFDSWNYEQCKEKKKREEEENARRLDQELQQTKASNECLAQAKAFTEQCQGSYSKVTVECDTKKLSAAGIKVDDIKGANGINDSAGAGSDLMATAKTAYSNYISSCEPVQKKCVEDCNRSKEKLTQCLNGPQNSMELLEVQGTAYNNITTMKETCEDFSKKIADAKLGLAKSGEVQATAENLDSSTDSSSGAGTDKDKAADAQQKKGSGSGGGMPGFSMPNFGDQGQQQVANPTPIATPTASQGCDNPANTDRVCQCLRNPAMCQKSTATSMPEGLSNVTDMGGDSQSSSAGFNPGIGAGGGFSDIGAGRGAGPSGEVGGKQGGGANVSGEGAFSGNGGGGLGGGGGSGSPYSTKVNGGFYGQSSSGGGSGYSGGSRGGSRSGSSSAAAAMEKPDLTKFLPGGKLDPNRGPSSMVGKDGITGPNEFNWDKMHRQFQRLWHEGDNFLSH